MAEKMENEAEGLARARRNEPPRRLVAILAADVRTSASSTATQIGNDGLPSAADISNCDCLPTGQLTI